LQGEDNESAAIDKLNGMLMNDKQVYVGVFLRNQGRDIMEELKDKGSSVEIWNCHVRKVSIHIFNMIPGRNPFKGGRM